MKETRIEYAIPTLRDETNILNFISTYEIKALLNKTRATAINNLVSSTSGDIYSSGIANLAPNEEIVNYKNNILHKIWDYTDNKSNNFKFIDSVKCKCKIKNQNIIDVLEVTNESILNPYFMFPIVKSMLTNFIYPKFKDYAFLKFYNNEYKFVLKLDATHKVNAALICKSIRACEYAMFGTRYTTVGNLKKLLSNKDDNNYIKLTHTNWNQENLDFLPKSMFNENDEKYEALVVHIHIDNSIAKAVSYESIVKKLYKKNKDEIAEKGYKDILGYISTEDIKESFLDVKIKDNVYHIENSPYRTTNDCIFKKFKMEVYKKSFTPIIASNNKDLILRSYIEKARTEDVNGKSRVLAIIDDEDVSICKRYANEHNLQFLELKIKYGSWYFMFDKNNIEDSLLTIVRNAFDEDAFIDGDERDFMIDKDAKGDDFVKFILREYLSDENLELLQVILGTYIKRNVDKYMNVTKVLRAVFSSPQKRLNNVLLEINEREIHSLDLIEAHLPEFYRRDTKVVFINDPDYDRRRRRRW